MFSKFHVLKQAIFKKKLYSFVVVLIRDPLFLAVSVLDSITYFFLKKKNSVFIFYTVYLNFYTFLYTSTFSDRGKSRHQVGTYFAFPIENTRIHAWRASVNNLPNKSKTLSKAFGTNIDSSYAA